MKEYPNANIPQNIREKETLRSNSKGKQIVLF
jgi:hypothetical protein